MTKVAGNSVNDHKLCLVKSHSLLRGLQMSFPEHIVSLLSYCTNLNKFGHHSRTLEPQLQYQLAATASHLHSLIYWSPPSDVHQITTIIFYVIRAQLVQWDREKILIIVAHVHHHCRNNLCKGKSLVSVGLVLLRTVA